VRALFHERADAGRRLAAVLVGHVPGDAVVIGLARGGVAVAAEVAAGLSLPLDALAVRKVGHPLQPEYGLGAVTPEPGGTYVRSHDGLDDDTLLRVVARARADAQALDERLHADRAPVALEGRVAVLVDDGLATGATMTAAVRWARHQGAARVVVAVPVGAAQSVAALREEADEVVCPYALADFGAVGLWYEVFGQVGDEEVTRLLAEHGAPRPS